MDYALQLVYVKSKCSCSCHYVHDTTDADFPRRINDVPVPTCDLARLSGKVDEQRNKLLESEALKAAWRERTDLEKKLRLRQHHKHRMTWMVFDNSEKIVPVIVKNSRGQILNDGTGLLKSRITKRQAPQNKYDNMSVTERSQKRNREAFINRMYNTKKGYYARTGV
jgi:hypothetical protein